MSINSADQPGARFVSVVLPCLNEAASVARCVVEAQEGLRCAGLRGEVIVVDNGSTDGSPALAAAAGARVIHEPRPGYGSALRAGFAAAFGDICVMADADLTYPLDRLGELVRPVAQGDADMVLGARLSAATRESMPLLHRFVGTPALSLLVRRATRGVSVSDSQSGFRAFRTSDFERLGARGTGMEFASELLILGAREGWRIREIQTGYRARVGDSKLNTFSDGMRHLRLILLLAPHLLLVWPAAALLAVGLITTFLSLLQPAGLALGSLQWQPVFFAPIAVVLGVQGLLAGMTLAYASSVVSPRVTRHYAFVGAGSFADGCGTAGICMVVAGLTLDGALLITSLSNGLQIHAPNGIGGMAMSMLMAGTSVALYGHLSGLIMRRRQHAPIGEIRIDDEDAREALRLDVPV